VGVAMEFDGRGRRDARRDRPRRRKPTISSGSSVDVSATRQLVTQPMRADAEPLAALVLRVSQGHHPYRHRKRRNPDLRPESACAMRPVWEHRGRWLVQQIANSVAERASARGSPVGQDEYLFVRPMGGPSSATSSASR
jgi:hypothetical protein